jgi:hypothetical protein
MSVSFTRATSWLLIGEAVLLALIVLSVSRLSEAKAALNDSSRNHQVCTQLADEIETMRGMTSVADETQETATLGASQLIALARECGMDERQVSSIQLPVAVEVEGTDYQRQDISIDLDAVTMEQLIRLALKSENLRDSAKITAINLTSNRQPAVRRQTEVQDSAELWNAELILTQLKYTARSAVR